MNLDLHTLRVLEEIFRTGSLSRTAQRLDLTQPAISMALGRLRRHYDDPLFVRVGNTMRPTPQAEGIRPDVSALIASMEATLNFRTSFDPGTTQRTFRIAVSDISQIVMGPLLIEQLSVQAPHSSVEFSSIGDRTPELLQNGSVDLALGLAPQMPQGFFQQALFKQGFVCLSRSDHPRIRTRLSLAQFRAEGHVVVVSSSTTHLIIERALEQQEIRRRVVVRIPNFMMMGKLVAGSDHLATVPGRAGLVMARECGLRAHPPPFRLPEYSVTQYWHERQLRDNGSRWLRELIQRVADAC
ncbi:MAG: LysR family transcriptional regulator [Ramlibacter sp.]|uniref:LysR family transcriptional regulator n=1 Tax=Ramlibacter sp. TaxID=1917967 RepID=UPI00262661E4|nr:LysR family transcriptional regulator [Ramlibacter sp.]MDB5750030.1 LysR family transcriptional regulator [Ramlibacter sp.]